MKNGSVYHAKGSFTKNFVKSVQLVKTSIHLILVELTEVLKCHLIKVVKDPVMVPKQTHPLVIELRRRLDLPLALELLVVEVVWRLLRYATELLRDSGLLIIFIRC